MSNQRTGIRVNREMEWRYFDTLPHPLRRIIASAPYKYALERFVNLHKQLSRQGAPLSEIRHRFISIICADIQRFAAETYGPDHPDATTNRLERKAA